MPIEIPSPEGSEQIVDRVRDAVGERFGESLTVTPAYRVEVVDLLSFTTSLGTAFNSHSPGRWQCLVGSVDDPQAAVDLVEEDGDYAVVSINEGTMAELLSSAARGR